MTQLLDLDDDSLLEVLDRLPPDQLFKMLRVNSRLRRLAGDKMRFKIKAIAINKPTGPFSSCTHNDDSSNEVLILGLLCKKRFVNGLLEEPSKAIFLSVLTKCTGIKSIDIGTGFYFIPDGLLLEVVRRCPELECIKLGKSFVKEGEWNCVLNLIGQKMVHFGKYSGSDPRHYVLSVRLLLMVVLKCRNIEQVEWSKRRHDVFDNRDLKAIKLLPKDCRVKQRSFFLVGDTFDDIFDELYVKSLNWSSLGDRVERLSSLKFNQINGLIHSVEFAGLKRLDVSETRSFDRMFINYLMASQFPRLEEFCFNNVGGLNEENFDALFQRMTSVKKLSIYCDRTFDEILHLPDSAIHQLKNLEIIDFTILNVLRYWQTTTLQKYVDGISSLKKLIVKSKCLTESIINEFKQFKLKQTRVEVDLEGLQLQESVKEEDWAVILKDALMHIHI